jgi:hypothetical protein
MIQLDPNSLVTKYFLWQCDHNVFVTNADPVDNKYVRRKGAYYLEHGTTLCHIFWATLWMPLVAAAIIGFLLVMLAALHVSAYEAFSAKFGIAAFFAPEFFVLGFVIAAALLTLILMGAGKLPFWKLVWLYLKGIKNRICPLVQFDAVKGH